MQKVVYKRKCFKHAIIITISCNNLENLSKKFILEEQKVPSAKLIVNDNFFHNKSNGTLLAADNDASTFTTPYSPFYF